MQDLNKGMPLEVTVFSDLNKDGRAIDKQVFPNTFEFYISAGLAKRARTAFLTEAERVIIQCDGEDLIYDRQKASTVVRESKILRVVSYKQVKE